MQLARLAAAKPSPRPFNRDRAASDALHSSKQCHACVPAAAPAGNSTATAALQPPAGRVPPFIQSRPLHPGQCQPQHLCALFLHNCAFAAAIVRRQPRMAQMAQRTSPRTAPLQTPSQPPPFASHWTSAASFPSAWRKRCGCGCRALMCASQPTIFDWPPAPRGGGCWPSKRGPFWRSAPSKATTTRRCILPGRNALIPSGRA